MLLCLSWARCCRRPRFVAADHLPTAAAAALLPPNAALELVSGWTAPATCRLWTSCPGQMPAAAVHGLHYEPCIQSITREQCTHQGTTRFVTYKQQGLCS